MESAISGSMETACPIHHMVTARRTVPVALVIAVDAGPIVSKAYAARKYALQALYTVLIARGNARRKSMNKILEILLVVCLSIASAGATSLSDQIASITDGQTISVDGYQTLSDLSNPQNLTLLGKGDESVLKVDSFFMAGDHKRLLLKNLVIKDCLRIHSYADVVAENCRFENASLYVWDASLYAKDCVFTGGRMKTCSDDGGALNLTDPPRI